ncbi:MAG: hypothetical protein V4808_06245 [Pseudomonadota bacterium]
MRILRLAAIVAAALTMAPTAQAQGIFGGLKGKKLEAAIQKAEVEPLGSEKNPVRVNMPGGERNYLARLRCADGSRPSFERAGSMGIGPFGNILDLYPVACTGKDAVDVYMDMYHAKDESRPIPGFTIE